MSVKTDAGPSQQATGLGAELSKRFRDNIQTYTIILAMVAIWIMFALATNGSFLASQNVSNLFRQMTVTSFLAIGMVFVIVTGNIDLSVGKLAGFVSVVAAYLQANVWYDVMPNQPLIAATLSVILGVGVGVLFGMLQGYIIAFLNVPAFIVTLGGMFVLNGAIGLITPPVGTVLNVVAGVGRLSLHQVIKGVNPFLLTYVLILALFVVFPQLVTAPVAWMR